MINESDLHCKDYLQVLNEIKKVIKDTVSERYPLINLTI